MITLDRANLWVVVEELRITLNNDYSELIELLGGEEALLDIFDINTINAIAKNLVKNGKIHNKLSDEYAYDGGLDIIEGLLNRQIIGNLGEFYNINPNYIISLSDEQKRAMAKCLSEGSEELEETLVLLWNKGIKTIACDGIEAQYIRMDIDFNQLEEVYTRILNQYKQGDDIRFSVYGYEEGEKYIFQIEGTDEKAFFTAIRQAFEKEYLQDGIMNCYEIAYEMLQDHYKYSNKELEERKKLIKEGKSDIAKDFIAKITNVDLSEKSNDWNDEKVEALIQDNDEAHIKERKEIVLEKDVEIEGLKTAITHSFEQKAKLQQELQKLQEENKRLELRYNEAVNIVKRTKDFVVNKLGRIPFIGKAVINAMNKELNQKALPEKAEDEGEINR
jgi:hypothetical protein